MRPILALLLVLALASIASAQLPEMPAVDSIVKPPIEQVTYDSWFLKTVVVRSDMDKCEVTLIVRRYNWQKKVLSPDPADERAITIANAYPLAAKYTMWQHVLGAVVQGAALAVQEDEYAAKIAAVDAKIAAAKRGDPQADVSALEAEKKPLQAGLDAVRQKMGPIGTADSEGTK